MEYVHWFVIYDIIAAIFLSVVRVEKIKDSGLHEDGYSALKAYPTFVVLGWFLFPCLVYYTIVGEPISDEEEPVDLNEVHYLPYE